MTRGAGFANADLDTGIARDPKWRRLARLQLDLARPQLDLISVAFAGYVGILAESWGKGERLRAIDAWPEIIPWSEEAVAAMRQVGLLDRGSRIPIRAWNEWFGAAAARRDMKRLAGSLGGQQKHANALASLDPSGSIATAVLPKTPSSPASDALPVRPSVRPSDSPLPPKGARDRSRRKNGQGPRQLREGSPEIDAKVLSSLEERTATWNATHPDDPLPLPPPADWFERPKA